METLMVMGTPVTLYQSPASGPAVVLAHGFAGSRKMMQGYALTLAQAGYSVYAYDFEGHGNHSLPMSGDVSSLDGTTRLLVQQTLAVVRHAAHASPDPVALVGHSMATDILVRAAAEVPQIGPMVLLSAFSLAITADHPKNLLLVTGAWEPGLDRFAIEAAQMVKADAEVGDLVMRDGVVRRAVIAPLADHVSILHARSGRAAAVGWLNEFYGKNRQPPVLPTGWALLALLASITVLGRTVSRLVPAKPHVAHTLRTTQVLGISVLPMILAPLLATLFETGFLPVLVADYLALHLLIYGAIQIALLAKFKPDLPKPSFAATLLLLIWGLGVFGLALDRYGTNFLPNLPRLAIIAALAVGAVPFMLADAWASHGASLMQRIVLRFAFLISLGLAVALDFEGLFFLLMISPVIVLFFLTFGTMGRAFARHHGPTSAGIALGLVLGWALGVSFPLFAS